VFERGRDQNVALEFQSVARRRQKRGSRVVRQRPGGVAMALDRVRIESGGVSDGPLAFRDPDDAPAGLVTEVRHPVADLA